jgi:hypothetical protein
MRIVFATINPPKWYKPNQGHRVIYWYNIDTDIIWGFMTKYPRNFNCSDVGVASASLSWSSVPRWVQLERNASYYPEFDKLKLTMFREIMGYEDAE